MADSDSFSGGDRQILMILWIPSKDRDGKELRDQLHEEWVQKSLHFFGERFGGATALAPGQGVWKSGDTGKLMFEKITMVHCYVAESELDNRSSRKDLGDFCRSLGKGLNQEVVAILIHDRFHLIPG